MSYIKKSFLGVFILIFSLACGWSETSTVVAREQAYSSPSDLFDFAIVSVKNDANSESVKEFHATFHDPSSTRIKMTWKLNTFQGEQLLNAISAFEKLRKTDVNKTGNNKETRISKIGSTNFYFVLTPVKTSFLKCVNEKNPDEFVTLSYENVLGLRNLLMDFTKQKL